MLLTRYRQPACLGFPRQTFYRWYDRYLTGGPEALADKPSRPDRVWNRIPDAVQGRIIDLALEVSGSSSPCLGLSCARSRYGLGGKRPRSARNCASSAAASRSAGFNAAAAVASRSASAIFARSRSIVASANRLSRCRGCRSRFARSTATASSVRRNWLRAMP